MEIITTNGSGGVCWAELLSLMRHGRHEASSQGLEQSRPISLKCPGAPFITLPRAAQSLPVDFSRQHPLQFTLTKHQSAL